MRILDTRHTCEYMHTLSFTTPGFHCDLLICMRQPPPMLSVATPPVTVKPSTTCAKCGKIKKSKKLSCCARGGAWYNKCGDEGDSKFDHTWLEGVQACKGKLTANWTGICRG